MRLTFPMGWAPVGATVDEKNILLGDLNSIDQLDPELRFERTGGPPVACRASVPRIVCAKLFGIGIVCAVSASYAPTADAALSCALSCAIAWVASVHYFFIVRARPFTCPQPRNPATPHPRPCRAVEDSGAVLWTVERLRELHDTHWTQRWGGRNHTQRQASPGARDLSRRLPVCTRSRGHAAALRCSHSHAPLPSSQILRLDGDTGFDGG